MRSRTADLLYRSGLLPGILRSRCRGRAVVLMYHRVAADGAGPQSNGLRGIEVSRRTFGRHLLFLKNNFRVLSQSEFLRCLEKKEAFPAGSVLITFDDGWRDNFENAYPLLKDEGLPAVVFPAAGFIGSSELFWQDRLRRSLAALRCAAADGSQKARLLRICSSAEVRRVIEADERRVDAAIGSCVAVFKKLPQEQTEKTVSTLERLAHPGGAKTAARNFLNWRELAEMADNGIDVGSHGLSHTILTAISDKGMMAREIIVSRQILESGLRRRVRLFSYPNGNFSEVVSVAVSRGGYDAAFATMPGANACTDDPFALKRVNIHEDMTGTMPLFLARVAGLW